MVTVWKEDDRPTGAQEGGKTRDGRNVGVSDEGRALLLSEVC